mmetsp:Transcript_57714/g.140962  ORF Transcript_57714/g.140962 Transcript_57714/m.140962 type:complete len:110 (+) Transcript_57714:1127-1456(+)
MVTRWRDRPGRRLNHECTNESSMPRRQQNSPQGHQEQHHHHFIQNHHPDSSPPSEKSRSDTAAEEDGWLYYKVLPLGGKRNQGQGVKAKADQICFGCLIILVLSMKFVW